MMEVVVVDLKGAAWWWSSLVVEESRVWSSRVVLSRLGWQCSEWWECSAGSVSALPGCRWGWMGAPESQVVEDRLTRMMAEDR